MGLLAKALLFAVKEASGPALRSFGTNIGVAIGRKLGRKIDPDFEGTDGDMEGIEIDIGEGEDGDEPDGDVEVPDGPQPEPQKPQKPQKP